jgi:hypothetical protein
MLSIVVIASHDVGTLCHRHFVGWVPAPLSSQLDGRYPANTGRTHAELGIRERKRRRLLTLKSTTVPMPYQIQLPIGRTEEDYDVLECDCSVFCNAVQMMLLSGHANSWTEDKTHSELCNCAARSRETKRDFGQSSSGNITRDR